MNRLKLAIVGAAIPIAAAASILTAGAAGASVAPAITNSTVHHAGSCTASGQFAACVASGTAWRPHRIRVHVHASPNQWVDVTWSDVCVRGTGVGQHSGSFTAFTPVSHVIRHSFRHPSSCSIAAEGQLHHGGWIHVYITYRRW